MQPTLPPMASATYIPPHHPVYQSPLKVPPIALQAPTNQAAIEVVEIVETNATVTATSTAEQDTTITTVESDKENTFKPINSSFSSDEQNNAETDLQGVDLDRIFERRNTPPRKRPTPQHYVYPQYPGQFPQPVYQTAGYVPM